MAFFDLGDLDPLARIAQRNPVLAQALAQGQRQKPAADPLPPLAPAEEQSVLGKIGSTALGGLGYAGEVLEKTFGGRAIRGLLGGKGRELLSVIPGSDLTGLTDVNDRVSGKELLGFDKNDDSWTGTLAGLGTELALDPGMYLSFGGGALTGAGRAAKMAGTLPATLTERATQGLGGLVGLGLPFRNPSVVLGASPAGAAVVEGAGNFLKGADALARAAPVVGRGYGAAADTVAAAGRYGRALFDPTVMGATTQQGQQAGAEASAAVKALQAEFRGRGANYADQLGALGHSGRGADLRQILENTFHGPVQPEVQTIADAMRADLAEYAQRADALGVAVPTWVDPLDRSINYFPRQQSHLGKPTGGFGARQPISVLDDSLTAARDPIFEGFAGGTEGVNRMLQDPSVYQMAHASNVGPAVSGPLASAEHVRTNYLTRITRDNVPAPPPALQIVPGSVEEAAYYADQIALRQHAQLEQGQRLVDWARNLDPQYRANDMAFFGNHPLADYERYFERGARQLGAGEASQNLLARTAVDASQGVPQGALRAQEALRQAGLTGTGAIDTLANRLGIPAADVAQRAVPQEALGEIARYMQPFGAPEAVSGPLQLFDKLTNLTKAFQTAIWPSFHVRNAASGWWSNLSKGGGSLASAQDAYNLLKGGTVSGLENIPRFAGMTPEQATAAIGREMYQHGIGGHMASLGREVVGAGGEPVRMGTTLEDILGAIPGRTSKSIGEALSPLATTQGRAWNPLNLAGVGTNADEFAPVLAGRQVGDVVEGVNRGSLYLDLARQGWDPAAAARQVLEGHFDYTPAAYTPFERTVLRRLIPFYSWSKGNIPLQLGQIAENPGGMAGTLARVAGDLRQQGGFLPDYLGQGLAIPLGEQDSAGQRRYLTKLDLPPEQAFEMLKGGPNWLRNSLEGVLGQANPLIKGPLEYATGRQFFTGRDAGDLYSQTGSQLLDALVMNSPLARLATTARTLTDPRKLSSPLAATALPLNLLTGARVSDVDIEKQKDVAARDAIKAELQGRPEFGTFSNIYLRPGMENLLSPEEAALYRLQKTIQLRKQLAR